MAARSDWSDWLPREISTADPTGVDIWYLGCNGLILKDAHGTTLLIDPYLGLGDPPRTIRMIPVPFDPDDVEHADAILATHEHVDHVHGPSQAPILANTGAMFYGPDSAIAVAREEEDWPSAYDVSGDQLCTISVGDVFDVGEFTVSVVATNDPDAVHPVGYVIEHSAGVVFHGGDTKPAQTFAQVGERYDIDLAVLAFGSVGIMPDRNTGEPTVTRWYNDENQIIEVANNLRADRLLPSHWDMWKRLSADPSTLHAHTKSFDYPHRLEVVEIGDRVSL